MRPDYAAPTALDEALALLAGDPNSALIAGGTDLVPAIRAGHCNPARIVDLRMLPLAGIAVEQDRVRIGARVTFTDILTSEALTAEFPALVAAASEVGGPPIRNRATIGGNLVNASPAADGAPPLLVYDASVVLAGPAGAREVPLATFFKGSGRTVLGSDEILTEVRVPRRSGPTAASFVKHGARNAMAISIVSVAVRVTGDGTGGVAECRIALGAVAPTPIRAKAAEGVLVAEGLGPDAVAWAAAAAAQASSPIDDIRSTAAYRRHMVEVLVRRQLTRVAADLEGDAGDG